jgi:hypothetical protein
MREPFELALVMQNITTSEVGLAASVIELRVNVSDRRNRSITTLRGEELAA